MTQDPTVGLAALSAYGVLVLLTLEFIRFMREEIKGDPLLSIFQLFMFSVLDVTMIPLLKLIEGNHLFQLEYLSILALGLPVLVIKWIETVKYLMPSVTANVIKVLSLLYIVFSVLSLSTLTILWSELGLVVYAISYICYLIFLAVKNHF